VSWLPRDTLTVNVEAEGEMLRVHDNKPALWFTAGSARISARQKLKPGELIVLCGNAPSHVIPFVGVFMPRAEWVW
jgi:hypothetical protein